MDHPLDAATALAAQPDGSRLGHTHPAWGNMVGPYGGITAAQALQAVLLHPDRLGDPVALTVNFCAPLAEGPFVAEARPARTNRSTQHWTVTLSQDGQPVVTATAVTAVRRETWGDDEHRMPEVPPPEAVPVTPGPRVEWLKRYEMRLVHGGLPAAWDDATHPDSHSRLWVRDQPPRPLDWLSLTAMADVFYPRRWRRQATAVPVGTVSMTVYYHADEARLRGCGDAPLLGQAQAQAFHGGYHDQTAQLWSRAGALLATTHQVVYYKA